MHYNVPQALLKCETTTTLPPPVPSSQEREPACLGYRWKHQDLQIVLCITVNFRKNTTRHNAILMLFLTQK